MNPISHGVLCRAKMWSIDAVIYCQNQDARISASSFFLSGFCKRVSSDPFKICNGDNNKEQSLKTATEFLLYDSGSLTFR